MLHIIANTNARKAIIALAGSQQIAMVMHQKREIMEKNARIQSTNTGNQ